MPSVSNSPSTMATENTNKSNQINAMLMRAWRERWDDSQWGTHIKSVSPSIETSKPKIRGLDFIHCLCLCVVCG